ncbi:hypothetical protein ABG79_02329 [Caloramator mitchellensis]|uniref:Uncharacterized protein n=1 Tax=Caloramator mitchellensis TaxID=908809 RepID=A0A0R3JR19_CALMK|nr:hypothetical protein [Caloramator mitchellensis]KRQ85904.1 hypothetical protein ABG79_02329 [Caloramator mitchellensis]
MDGEIASVIKNLIHIDKNASELREKFKLEIENRKRQIGVEIEKLKQEIIEDELININEFEKEKMDKAKLQAEKIINIAKEECSDLEKKYSDSKAKLIKKAIDELFK